VIGRIATSFDKWVKLTTDEEKRLKREKGRSRRAGRLNYTNRLLELYGLRRRDRNTGKAVIEA
jgi:hypothetical protein